MGLLIEVFAVFFGDLREIVGARAAAAVEWFLTGLGEVFGGFDYVLF